jgi:hypothetical protein
MNSDLAKWLAALVWGSALSAGFVYGLVRQARPQTFPRKMGSWLPMSAVAGLGVLTMLMDSGRGSWGTAFTCIFVLPPAISFAMAVGRSGWGNRIVDLIYGDRAERARRLRDSTYRAADFQGAPMHDTEGRDEV